MIDLNALFDVNSRISVGNFLASQQDFARARKLFLSALDIDKDNVPALCIAAFMALKAKDMDESVDLIQRALSVEPEHAPTLGIAGLIAQEASKADNRFEKAREYFEKSLAINPKDAAVHLNYAYMLQLVGDYRRALEVYTLARDLNVMDVNTRFQRSMCMLTLANTPEEWRQALDEYEIRHLLYRTGVGLDKPMYTGKESGGCYDHLLIVCEQGIGDAVMCARWVRDLVIHGQFGEVSFLCLPSMEGLLKRVHCVSGVYTDIKNVPAYDYYVPCLSLLRTEGWPGNKPNNDPYLMRQDTSTKKAGNLRVGLCWQGNPAHGNDRYRSIGPDLFSDAFANLKGVDFHSMHTREINRFKPDFVNEYEVESLTALTDMISCMDLVVTVDTSTLHIAGALGVPTIGLLASNPDWRWTNKGDKTDWYPSVSLIRSDRPLKWKPALEEAARQIQEMRDIK